MGTPKSMALSLTVGVCLALFPVIGMTFLLGLMVYGGLLLINDAMAWYYRGAPGETAAFWVRVANWMTFFLTDIILAVSTAYIHFKVYGRKAFNRSNWLFNISMIVATNASIDIIPRSFPTSSITTSSRIPKKIMPVVLSTS